MRQISKNTNKTKNKSSRKPKMEKPLYGTSKLEEDFARDFLDKLGLDYIYQFEAKEIGRYYDFYISSHNILIEIDGGYW